MTFKRILPLLGLMVGFATTHVYASPNILNEATAIEAQMDKVKPDPMNSDVADEQDAIIHRSIDFVKKALSQRQVDDQVIRAVARIMVRNAPYDQADDLAQMDYDVIKKHWKALNQELKHLESAGTFSSKAVERVRTSIDIAINVRKRGGTDVIKKK